MVRGMFDDAHDDALSCFSRGGNSEKKGGGRVLSKGTFSPLKTRLLISTLLVMSGGRKLRGGAERDHGGCRGHGDEPSDHPPPSGSTRRLQRVGCLSCPCSRIEVSIDVSSFHISITQSTMDGREKLYHPYPLHLNMSSSDLKTCYIREVIYL